MANHAIKMKNNQAKQLIALLGSNDIPYTLKEHGKRNTILLIADKYVNSLFDLLTDELSANGVDPAAGDVNNYGKDIDDIAGIFAMIKYSNSKCIHKIHP